jgi:ATP/ADP translocase
MASRFGSYTLNARSLGERSYTGGQVLQAFIGLLTAIGLIAGGAIIINQNEKIKELTNDGSDFNLLMASIFIIAGSLLVLFGLFKMFTKSA